MSKKLYISGLPFTINESKLEREFAKFGEIENVFIPRDRETNRPQHYGFVTYKDEGDAYEAMYKMDGKTIGGRTISVSEDRSTGKGGRGGGMRHAGGPTRYRSEQRERGGDSRRRDGERGGRFKVTDFEGSGDDIRVIAVDEKGNDLRDNRGNRLKPQSMGLSDVITGTRNGNKFIKDRSSAKLVEYSRDIVPGIGNIPDSDRNPFNFAEWHGDAPWKDPDPNKAKHDQEYRDRNSGIIDVTFESRTPIFVPQGKLGGGSSEFFKCHDMKDKERFALPGSAVKGAVRSLFEILTNSRAGITSDNLDEVPLYRRRAEFLFKIISEPTETTDGTAVWCPFEFLSKEKRVLLPNPKQRPSQLNVKDGDDANKIKGIAFVDPWKANLLWVDNNFYRHKGKVALGYVPRNSVTVTIPQSVCLEYKSMFLPRVHRHFEESLENALRNPQCAYNNNKIKKAIATDYDSLPPDKRKQLTADYARKLASSLYPLKKDEFFFGITNNQTKTDVRDKARVICFGRNVNFLWPARKSPKAAMGRNGAFAARNEEKARFDQSDSAETTFGFVANHKDDNQHPFRGRVRFTTFWGPEIVDASKRQIGEVQLMSLTAPPGTKAKCRPLYLKTDTDSRPPVGTTWTTPGAKLRGRKIYWHQTPSDDYSQDGIANVHLYEKMRDTDGPQIEGEQIKTLVKIKPLRARTEFVGQVHFTNLTDAELGALLASFDPSLLWQADGDEKRYGIKIGKAKPRGLGSVAVKEMKVNLLTSARERYCSLKPLEFVAVTPSDKVMHYKTWAVNNAKKIDESISDWKDLPFAKDLVALLEIPKETSLRIYPPRFDMYGWMPEFGKPNGEASDDPKKWPTPMSLARAQKPKGD